MTHSSHLLTPEEVFKYWSKLSSHIDSALEHSGGELQLFDVARDAMNGQAHIWATFSGDELITVIVTRFLAYQRTKMFQIMTCSGSITDWDGWTEHHQILEDFAKKNGCSAIEIWGRKGWLRRLQHLKSRSGQTYKPLYYVYSMEI